MMNTANKIIPMHASGTCVIKNGSVASVLADEIVIHLAGNTRKAKRAFSCIIDPEPGDIVICTESEDGIIYILGIAERPQHTTINVSFPSDTNIQTRKGCLGISAPETITIASKNVNSFSKRAIHKSHETVVSSNNIAASGSEFQASFKTIRLISNLINTMAKQVVDRFKGYIRQTEESDMVKAGQMTRNADGLYAMDSKYTIMNSKKSTKIDGEKILMG